MTARLNKLIVPLVIGIALGGCVVSNSPTISYLQLSAGQVPPGNAVTPRVFIDAVQVPDYLLRNELLRRTGEHGLRYENDMRWAEPVDVGVQRVLALRLSAALNSYSVISFPAAHSGELDWRLDVSLRHFEAMDDEAHLLADIQLYPQDGNEALSEQFELRQKLNSATGTDIAAALSSLLEQLAEHIAGRMLEAESIRE